MSGFISFPSSPLTRAERRVVFYLAALVFFLLAPLIILYSVGYNVDIRTRSLLRTGGIFVKTSQPGFKLFVNGVLAKETAFFSKGALVIDLKPDLYVVRVEKEGFRPWQRVIPVAAETISEFRSVILFPEKIEPEIILNMEKRNLSIDEFRILEGTPWIIVGVKERRGLTYFFNRESGLVDAAAAFDRFGWDAKSKLLAVYRPDSGQWSVINMAPRSIREERLFIPKSFGKIVSVGFHPEDGDVLFILNQEGTLDGFNKKTLEVKPLIADVHSFAARGSKLLFLTTKGFFAASDLNGENMANYGRKGFYLSDKPARIESSSKGDMFVIDSAGGFFVKRRDEPEISPIAGNIHGAAFSSRGDKILFWSEREIEVMRLEDEIIQPFRKAGSREKVVSSPGEPIRSVSWFGKNESHVMFVAGEFMGISDIDDRGGGPSTAIILENVAGGADYLTLSGEIIINDESALYSVKPF